jgi:hypothetical protein
MTGYTVHTGSTEKFADGWDQIFGGGKQASAKAGKKGKKKTPQATQRSKKAAKGKGK